MGRVHLIHFHGATKAGLEAAMASGETLELGEIAVITGEEPDSDENNEEGL